MNENNNDNKEKIDQTLQTNNNTNDNINLSPHNPPDKQFQISDPSQNLNPASNPNPPVNTLQNKIITNRPNINFSANLLQISSRNLVFIDKSDDLNKLFSLGLNRILILRPRLFGKSIICDIIESLFSGNKPLLQSLNAKISNTWDFSTVYPVIRFSMRFYAKNFDEFYIHFSNIVTNLLNKFHIPIDIINTFGVPQDAFAYLMQSFSNNGQKIVIIIEDIESCLINLSYDNPDIHKIKLCIQQLFNYISNMKDSLAFLLLTGIDNFYDLSNLCVDLTESPDIAGLFGITLKDIRQLDFFVVDEKPETYFTAFQYKKVSNTFQKTIQDIFNYLREEFTKSLNYISKTNTKSFIHIKYLQTILLNCGGNCFSPNSDISVSNYADFLGMCYNGKAEHFWLEMIFKRQTDSISDDLCKHFQYYPNHTKIYDEIIANVIYNDIHDLSPLFDNYRYLMRFGFFTYRKEKVYPTNFGILALLFSSTIDLFKNRVGIDLHSWSNLPFSEIVSSSFINFYKTARIPIILKANNCIEVILSIFISSIYKNTQKMLMKDGSFIIYSYPNIFKFVDIEHIEDYVNSFSTKDTVYLINLKDSSDQSKKIIFYFKMNSKLTTFSIEIPPYFDATKMLGNEGNQKNGVFSFTDAVLNIIFITCWGKQEGIDKYFIAAELMKKMPELSDDRALDKKICLALQLLCQNGKVRFYTQPDNKTTLYTLVKNVIPISQ